MMMVIGFDLILSGFDIRSEVGVPLGSLSCARRSRTFTGFSLSSVLFHA